MSLQSAFRVIIIYIITASRVPNSFPVGQYERWESRVIQDPRRYHYGNWESVCPVHHKEAGI